MNKLTNNASTETTRPLHVVAIVPYDIYYFPFAIRSITFCRILAERGHRVRLFYRPLPERKRRTQIHFDPLGAFDIHEFDPNPLHWGELSSAISACDVVHVQKSQPACIAAAVTLAKLHNKALHYDWDDDDLAFCLETARDAITEPNVPLAVRMRRAVLGAGGAPIVGGLEWAVPKLVDTMGAASIALRKKGVAWGCPQRDIFPARVGVSSEQFHPNHRDEQLRQKLGLTGPTVLYSGHFDVHRELRFFVEAVKTMAARAPAARCLVLGGGSGRAHLVSLIKGAELEHVVRITDHPVPFAQMPRHIASCDMGAVPLRDTPRNRSKSSLTLIEYMASGLACVTHNVGDTPWLLGETGHLAPPDDPVAFGEILAQLANNAESRTRLASLARKRAAERLSWEASATYLEAAYLRAIAKKHSGIG